MNKKRNNRGFTMVELLAVVALIGILTAVGFIGVQSYQKRVTGLEEKSVAKEIFVAAQNHLTMARNENYMGIPDSSFGNQMADEADRGIYYIVCNGGTAVEDTAANIKSDGNDMLNFVLLPFGAIDESVRHDNFIIRYQPQYGIVLDVFYSKTSSKDSRYGYDFIHGDYQNLIELAEKAGRKNESIYYNNKVIGYYGGPEAAKILKVGQASLNDFELKKPTLTIKNAETLTVIVKDNNTSKAGYTLKLIIKGESSGAQKAITLVNGTVSDKDKARITSTPSSGEYNIVLDDITNIMLDDITKPGLHFSELVPDKGTAFTPGENITIQAVAYNSKEISNIGYSDVEKTNSLFEKIVKVTIDENGKKIEKENLDSETDKVYTKAYINNVRHLENLDSDVSGFEPSKPSYESGVPSFTITNAEQSTDISWEGFIKTIKPDNADNVVIHYKQGSGTTAKAENTAPKCYKPVNLNYVLNYDGGNHNVSNLNVKWAGDAGMFGTVENGGSIMNLALIDVNIVASAGNAGALAGTLTNTTVENVIAYNSSNDATTVNVSATAGDASATAGDAGATAGDASATAGDAGGLIGTAENCTVTKSAASLIVKSSAENAGGLIGSVTGDKADKNKITACYSGGHTKDGNYDKNIITKKDGTTETVYNVTAAVAAGGLIGDAGSAQIEDSYSTCSVKGGTAGGFIGTGEAKVEVGNSYATGLVDGTTIGAFAGVSSLTVDSDCWYYEIINEIDGTYSYLSPLVAVEGTSDGKNEKLKALDADAESYETFVEGQTEWTKTKAVVYDAKLGEYYNDKNTGEFVYNLRGIKRLIPSGSSTTINDTDFVYVHHGDWPAPEIFVVNKATTSG